MMIMVNSALAILLKFGSIVCLKIALDEYQNLSANGFYFIWAINFCLAPSCLTAPLFAFDHQNCMPRNFLISKITSEYLAMASLIATAIPVIFYIINPRNWRRFVCCKKGKKRVVAAAFDETAEDEHPKGKTFT